MTRWPKDRRIRFEYQSRATASEGSGFLSAILCQKSDVFWFCEEDTERASLRASNIKKSEKKTKKDVDFRSEGWYIVSPSNDGEALKNAGIL